MTGMCHCTRLKTNVAMNFATHALLYTIVAHLYFSLELLEAPLEKILALALLVKVNLHCQVLPLLRNQPL